MFIHDDEDAIISMLLVFMGIYMYTFIYFGMHKLWFGPGLFPPYHMFIHNNENAINVYFEGSKRQNFGNCYQEEK